MCHIFAVYSDIARNQNFAAMKISWITVLFSSSRHGITQTGLIFECTLNITPPRPADSLLAYKSFSLSMYCSLSCLWSLLLLNIAIKKLLSYGQPSVILSKANSHSHCRLLFELFLVMIVKRERADKWGHPDNEKNSILVKFHSFVYAKRT